MRIVETEKQIRDLFSKTDHLHRVKLDIENFDLEKEELDAFREKTKIDMEIALTDSNTCCNFMEKYFPMYV